MQQLDCLSRDAFDGNVRLQKKKRKACVKVGIKKKRMKRQREEKGEREKGGKKKVKGSNGGERLLERENYSSY